MEHFVNFLTWTWDLLINNIYDDIGTIGSFLFLYVMVGALVCFAFAVNSKSPLYEKPELATILITLIWVVFLPIGHILLLSLLLYVGIDLFNDTITKAKQQFEELRNGK